MCQICQLSFLWAWSQCTFICLAKPAVDPRTLLQNWHELPVGCCLRTYVKWVSDNLLYWDFIWLDSPALDGEPYYKCYKHVQALKFQRHRSSSVSEVRISDGNFQFSVLETLYSFHRSLFPWLIDLPSCALSFQYLYWAHWGFTWIFRFRYY